MENHALVPCGKKIMNWKNPPCADTFIDRRGNKAKVPRTKASGIHFRTMELNHENEGVVFQIGNVLLHDSVILDWDRWQPPGRVVASDPSPVLRSHGEGHSQFETQRLRFRGSVPLFENGFQKLLFGVLLLCFRACQ